MFSSIRKVEDYPPVILDIEHGAGINQLGTPSFERSYLKFEVRFMVTLPPGGLACGVYAGLRCVLGAALTNTGTVLFL